MLYHVHQRLCMAFPSPASEEDDSLFLKPFAPSGFQDVHGPRTDKPGFSFSHRPSPCRARHDIGAICTKAGLGIRISKCRLSSGGAWQIKPYNPQFQNGQLLRFRLAANPTMRLSKVSKGADGKLVREEWIGKRVPVATDQLGEWLTRQAAHSGFSVERLDVVQSIICISEKEIPALERDHEKQENGSLRYVHYEGSLKVTDSKGFACALIRGIGPAKGFGFGLLSIAPVKD